MGKPSQDASERAGGSRSAGEFLPVRNRPSARSAYRRARRTDAPPCTRRSRGCSPKPRRAAAWASSHVSAAYMVVRLCVSHVCTHFAPMADS